MSNKFGFISILGRPNAGKSTLMNSLVGEKISIVSKKQQTTRDRITGIMQGEGYQAVFLDTPGIHGGSSRLSKYMQGVIDEAAKGVDVTLYLVPADRRLDDTDREYLKKLRNPIVVITKCDIVKDKEQILLKIEEVGGGMPVSAKTGKGMEQLKAEILSRLPEGDAMYPEDIATDRSSKFIAAELIREQALNFLSDEIPHGVGVMIEKFEYKDNGLLVVNAVILCEKKTHKPIIIGKGGASLKRISTGSRIELEALFGTKVYLETFVKIKEDWRDRQSILNELGYRL